MNQETTCVEIWGLFQLFWLGSVADPDRLTRLTPRSNVNQLSQLKAEMFIFVGVLSKLLSIVFFHLPCLVFVF